MARARAFTLVEIIIVLCFSLLIFLPVLRLVTHFKKFGDKGYDRLESLNSARLAIERLRRDLFMLCFDDRVEKSLRKFKLGPIVSYRFKAFPQTAPSMGDESSKLVDEITYTFDPGKNTLVRKLLPGVLGASAHEMEIGRNFTDFSIVPKKVFGYTGYVIKVSAKAGIRGEEKIDLQTTVRSKHQCLLQRHTYQVPNVASELKIAK